MIPKSGQIILKAGSILADSRRKLAAAGFAIVALLGLAAAPAASQSVISSGDFAPIYSEADFRSCAAAQPADGALGLGLNPLEARGQAIARCLAQRWAGGSRWRGAALDLSGERARAGSAFRAGAPIGITVTETFGGVGAVIGWDSRGYVTATTGGGEERSFPAPGERYVVIVTRLGEETPLQEGRGLAGVSLPEGVYGIEVRLERPATPSSPAGVEVLRRVVAVADPASERQSAWLQMRITALAGAASGNGVTLAPRRTLSGYGAGYGGSDDRSLCENRIHLAADALLGEGIVETDLTLVSESAEWRSYPAAWRLLDADGAVIASEAESSRFSIDPRQLRDDRYTVLADLQPRDRPADTGLRFQIEPAEFILTVNCTAPTPAYQPGAQVLAQLAIRRNIASTGQPSDYDTIQTNAEAIRPVDLLTGGQSCFPARFDAWGRFGVIGDTGAVSYDALNQPQPMSAVQWRLMRGDQTVASGRGPSFTIDPATVGDGSFRLMLEADPAAGPARTLKYLDIRGCGGGADANVATDAPQGGAVRKVCEGDVYDGALERVEVVECVNLAIGPDEDPNKVELVPAEFGDWFDDAERAIRRKIDEKAVSPDPNGRNEPLVDEFARQGWTEAQCAAAIREIRRREGVLRTSCGVPQVVMQSLFDFHGEYRREKALLTKLTSTVGEDAEFLLEGFPQKVRGLAGDYSQLVRDAEADGVLYRACSKPPPEILPGIRADRLIWKAKGVAALGKAQTRFSAIQGKWRSIFDKDARKAYDGRVGRLEGYFGDRRAEITSIISAAERARARLYGLWIGGEYPHCLGDIGQQSAAVGIPDLPGMKLAFSPAPRLQSFPAFDLLKAQYRPGALDWKLDASKIMRRLRQEENDRALKNLQELEKLFTVGAIAKSTGDKVWKSVAGAFNYILHTPLHEFGEIENKVTGWVLDFAIASDYERARMTTGVVSKAYDVLGPQIGQALVDYGRGMSQASHHAFLDKFNEATSLPWNEAYVNMRAYLTLREANMIAVSAKAEIDALSSMNQFLLETFVIPQGISGATSGAAKLLKIKKAVSAKHKLAQRRLDRLKQEMTPERAAKTQEAFDKIFDADDIATALSNAGDTFSPEEIAALQRQAGRLEEVTKETRIARARAKMRAALERKERNAALRGEPDAKARVNKLDELVDEIEDLDSRRADIDATSGVYRRKIERLEDSGDIDADQAEAINDALPNRNPDPDAVPDPDSEALPANPGSQVAERPRPTRLRGVLRDHDPEVDPPLRISVVRNGEAYPALLSGHNTSGRTADILFAPIRPDGKVKALKVFLDDDDYFGGLEGYDAAKSNGIDVIDIENRVEIAAGRGETIIDPVTGARKKILVRDRLKPEQIGDNAELDKNGRLLDVEKQQALVHLTRELIDRKVFWGDLKLANVAFVRKNGVLRAAVLDSNYLRSYRKIARQNFGDEFASATKAELDAFYEELRKDQIIQSFSNNGNYAQKSAGLVVNGGAAGSLYRVIDPSLVKSMAPDLFKRIDDVLIKDPNNHHEGFAKAWGLGETSLPDDADLLLEGAKDLSEESRDVSKTLGDLEKKRDDLLGVDEKIGAGGGAAAAGGGGEVDQAALNILQDAYPPAGLDPKGIGLDDLFVCE